MKEFTIENWINLITLIILNAIVIFLFIFWVLKDIVKWIIKYATRKDII